MPIRIGVDANCWFNTRGYGRHARALLSALVRLDEENHYTFFVDTPDQTYTLPPQASVQHVYASTPTVTAASANGHRSIRDMWRSSRAMAAAEFDVLLFPTIYSFVPVLSHAKKVVMIHDVIAETYPELTLPTYMARFFWKTKVTLGCWQADMIATVSDYARQGILQHFQLAPERVAIVGEASDPIFRVLDDSHPTPHLATLGITTGRRYVIYVGGFSPHKNLHLLVTTFAKLVSSEEFAEVRLVMVGEYAREVFHSYFSTIKHQVEEYGIGDRVIFTGYLPDEELVVLLNLSTVLVLPSLMEGFGLPAVEAAACGCPVIATTASPLPGLLGEGGIYVAPTSEAELTLALRQVLASEDVRQRMRQAGLAATRQLTWEAAAQQLQHLLQQVVGTVARQGH